MEKGFTPGISINTGEMSEYEAEIEFCGQFMKYGLLLMNLIIFIGGAGITALAALALDDKIPAIGELVGNDLLTGAVYVLLVGGIVVAFIAFFGCIGASREVKCMILTYFIVMLLLFVTMIIGGVLGYVFREKLLNVDREMKSSIRLYDSRKSIRDAWDITQSTHHCCGVDSWRDWGKYGLNVPESCCREILPGQRFNCNSGSDTVNPSNAYVEGCINGTNYNLHVHSKFIGGASLGLGCMMFFAIIMSCVLFKTIQ
ncbi:CD151 antigen isoform X1 [Linepithema humile]|uniref:CD151 antigen isoform X1 n=2 Tax=Linepithema humile TaxID=83485 RepID=UPI00351E9D64